MKYITRSEQTFDQTVAALHVVVPKHQFGILHVHNIKGTLNGKGVPFENEVSVFEVCNPHKAAAVLQADMSLNMVLPCRISVWEENGVVKLGTILPTALLAGLNDSPALLTAAEEVEQSLIAIIEDAKRPQKSQ